MRLSISSANPDSPSDAVARNAGWGEPLPRGTGRGVALAQQAGVLVAEVVEASVDARGRAAVHRIVTMGDNGAVRCASDRPRRRAWPTLAAAFANALFAASGQRAGALRLAAPALA